MVTLVTGATGTTGRRVVAALEADGVTVRRASRSASGFDWADPTTHDAAFDGADALYLMAPVGEADPLPVVGPVLRRALERGLRRVVLLSSSLIEPSSTGYGGLATLVREAPEWTVLRPSWFAQNFTGDHAVAAGVRAGRVVTATGRGRVPFVDADDIAAVAAVAVQGGAPGEQLITGPAALSYDEACDVAAEVVGHPVEHLSVSFGEFVDHQVAAGLPRPMAEVLAGLDELIAASAEDRITDVVERVTGRPPRPLDTVLRAALA
ncbi:ergot alkaloid biosynthesis protein [Actinomycetospora soli]|uniref:ergot alkaloid biosynthesis protein n=1 Tax=Actinomycetospora soli TaxID=2893887 RepID=UPI001E62F1A1|nr:ergot alkaloid biosynthesis protein [Actinomycetospora soli]MCD2185680.1 ergot alkaloid biosynthesis protein [Actinomycetospora soli]